MHRAVSTDRERERPSRLADGGRARSCAHPGLSVLLVAASDNLADRTAGLVESAFGNRCAWQHTRTVDDGNALMQRNEHDIYLLADDLSGDGAAALVRSSINAGCRQPIIVLASHADPRLDLKALEAGAADCLPLDELTPGLLERSIRHALVREHTIKSARGEIDHLSAEIARLNSLRDVNHRFVDDACHDFRSPLTVIKEFAAIIADGLAGDVNEEQLEFLEIILTRVDQLSQMVDSILDASRLESDVISVKREEHAAAELIDRSRPTLEQLASRSGAKIHFSVADTLPNVFADADSVGRIIVNLVTNACKFIGDDGEIEVWATAGDDMSVKIGITDNGPGIAPDHVKIIFDRFQQLGQDTPAAKSGLGLGLHIASELARVNFGTLSVESEPNKGSTFAMTLPVFDVDHLIPLHFRFLKTSRHDFQSVSMAVATTRGEADAEALAEIERFLSRQIRTYDLLLGLNSSNWLACVACTDGDLASITTRIERAYAEHNRNRPEGALPDISFRSIGSWATAGRQEGLSDAIRSAYAISDRPSGIH